MATRRGRFPREVFLSHATPDRAFADRLAAGLRRNHVPVWYSRTNIVGAQQWHDEIGEALARCDTFVVVLSPAAVSSPWVKHELVYALNHRHYAGRITPVLLRRCRHERLSWTLGNLQFVRFDGGFDGGCRDLLRVWGQGFRT